MGNVTIYHNPNCGTSRNVLALLREKGIEPKVVEYFKTRLTMSELRKLLKSMDISARSLLRTKDAKYIELELDNDWDDENLIHFMVEFPQLMNRPIVVTDKGAKLCRPVETVLELL